MQKRETTEMLRTRQTAAKVSTSTVLPDGMYIFRPKIPIWVNFGRSCNGRCWYFYVLFVYFAAKWYILCPFGTFSGRLVYFSRVGILYREKSGNPALQMKTFFPAC
jgi:hypothetical protein